VVKPEDDRQPKTNRREDICRRRRTRKRQEFLSLEVGRGRDPLPAAFALLPANLDGLVLVYPSVWDWYVLVP
jgi:hypothetical protein